MITTHACRAAAVAALLLPAPAAMPQAAHDAHAHSPKLGNVHFKADCNEGAQREFNVAMAYYHSFAWQHIDVPLDKVLAADPTCGMAHWARALAMLDNPFTWPLSISAKTLAEGPALLERARTTGLKNQRERDYVEALGAFFQDHATRDHRSRSKALEASLGEVAGRYPEDSEASILHALIMSANFDPADRNYTNQLRAARILEPIFKHQPDHPGAAHYLIHSYDYPPIAKHGVDAARRYAKIAPDAPHALHMPSHIFTRVGAWQDSIDSNRASAAVAPGHTFDKLHALDYLVYAHLQLVQDKAAQQVVEQARVAQPVDNFAFAFASAAIPARLALERGKWDQAASLALWPAAGTYPWSKYPAGEALNAYARGIGAALGGNAAAAGVEANRLQSLRDAMAALKSAYWVEQIEIQRDVVQGLAMVQEGKASEGAMILSKAADREDATQKHVVTPGPLVPAREALAQVLLANGHPSEALRAFQAVLEREPNRYRAMAGAAAAAERANDGDQATRYKREMAVLAQHADAQRE